MDLDTLSSLNPRQIYEMYAQNSDPQALLAEGRTKLARRLMTEQGLSARVADYAANQILTRADQIITSRRTVSPSDY